MSKLKSASDNIDKSLARSINFELTIADIAKRSEKRAWWVAFSAIAMALILAGGYFYMLPLKQKVPYLVMADAYTGTSTVARLVASPSLQNITASEAINRSNVAHYVLARESYDDAFLNLQDWTTVMTMSAPAVAASYRALYSPSNEKGPYKVYGRTEAIRVKILSIVLLGPPGRTPTGATVRFQRSLYGKNDGGVHPLDNKIATLTFKYVPDLQMADKYRIENPLGFQVTDYRVDNDYDATPPNVTPQTATDDAQAPAASVPQAVTAASPVASPMPPTAPAAPSSQPVAGAAAPAPTPVKNANGAVHQ